MRICFFGTYDADQPRTRVLLEGLRQAGATVLEHRIALWAGTDQKIGAARRPAALVGQLGRFVRTYACLLVHACRLPLCDAVIYPHFGQLDLLLTGWIFRRRGIPVIWDALISAFDTAAGDRQLLDVRSIRARGFAWLDRAAGRRADRVLADTPQNAAFWQERFGVAADKLRVVPVGAEDMFAHAPLPRMERTPMPDATVGSAGDDDFSRSAHTVESAGSDDFSRFTRRQATEAVTAKLPVFGTVEETAGFEALFFGKYIPLHGIETILRAAAQLAAHPDIRITMIGTGQERPMADSLAAALGLRNVRFVDWMPYADLPATLAAADLCLGIFGAGDKARRVVPNKAYQALAAGRPLITADTPAARAGLWRDGLTAAWLVPAGDPDALAAAILDLSRDPARRAALAADAGVLHDRCYRSALIGQQVAGIVREILEAAGRAQPGDPGSDEDAKTQKRKEAGTRLHLIGFASLRSDCELPAALPIARL